MAEAQAMIQAVQQAANAAAEAAQALRAVGVPKSSGFAEASKTIQAPKEFGSAASSEDAANWTDFAFSFRQWLCFADEGYSADLQYVEEHGDSLVSFKDTAEGLASKSRSTKLYAILSGVLRNRPLKVLRQVQNNNGMEVWRQLHNLFTPRTKVRSMAILSAVMGFPNFVKEKSLIEQVANLERLADEYRKASGKDVSEDILPTTLVRVLPKQIQQHIQLGMTDSSTFQEVKDKVLAYERVSASWSRDRVLLECGAASLGTVTSYASTADSGPGPMEVNMVSKGKGKKGKGDKGKSKGKGSSDKGKGKGKGSDKGKGKGQGQKGQQKGYGGGYNSGQPQQRAKLDSNVCAYCGKTGHWAKECRKKMADQQQQQVRLVGSDGNESRQDTAYSTTGSVSTGAGSQAVRLVQFAPHVEDLTSHSCPSSPAGSPVSIRVVSSVFDMSSTDGDGTWTVSPFCNHVRAVSTLDDSNLHHGVACEIILDSGADTSALPLRFGQVGVEDVMPGTSFVDAQGMPLNVTGSRIAHVAFGDVVFKERFIISDITAPLLALGSVLRSGWNIIHEGDTPYLVKGERRVEVLFRNNSLCAKGHIQVVTQAPSALYQPSIRAVQLGMVLRCLADGWNRIHPHLFAIKTKRPRHVDTTLAPSDELMWLRTTLVFREGTAWEVDEYCEPIADLRHNLEEEFVFPEPVLEVITLARKYAVPDSDLGFYMYDRSRPVEQAIPDEDDYEPSIAPDPIAEEPPTAPDGEPLEEDRIVPFEDDTAVVDGITMSMECNLKTLQAGCTSLGLSGRGGKAKCLKRMVDHLRAQSLMAAHGATVRLRAESERLPVGQFRPDEPSQQEIENHCLTHEPFQSWCSLCVQYRGRQDPHPASDHTSSGHSLLSMDFGFCSRMEDESDKQTCLFLHDRSTKMMAAIPTPQKGGRSLQHLITETTRFVMGTQHKDLAIRSDREPSILAVVDGVKRACRNMGITIHDEGAPVHDHQANGAAEVTVQVLRQKAGLLIQQIEDKIAAGRVIFGCNHPLFCWSLIHAGWLHDRYVVHGGQTAYERAHDRYYSGKLAMFGEDILGYLAMDKGGPRWRHGIWLGKIPSGDMHVVGTAEGVFLTRSIRRNPIPFNLNRFADLENYPWEFGLAALGNKLVHNKRVTHPLAFGVGATLPPQIDVEAIQVQKYARENPNEDVEDETQAGQAIEASTDAIASSVSPAVPSDADHAHGHKRPEDPVSPSDSPKKARTGDAMPVTPVDDTMLDDSDVGHHAPKTPKLDETFQQNISAVTSTNLEFYEHEDEQIKPCFADSELDGLEEYDMNFYNDELLDMDEMDDEEVMKRLTFPFTKHEPHVSAEQLMELDALADSLEIKRLFNLGVLTSADEAPADAKSLSTRFVRTWREKVVSGSQVWLRRSRFVAREFAWLQPDRDALFSPASSSIVARLLPAMCLDLKDREDAIMASIDVKDAFLTVPQETPTTVRCQLADGQTRDFSLGKVLPGQRDGSLLWHKAITGVLKSELNMEVHEPYPCILKTPDNSCIVLIHVDDILVVGKRKFVMERLVKCLEKAYTISTQFLEKPGDELSFLKRAMTMQNDGRLTIQVHHKHVQHLCDLLKLNPKLQNKKTPGHADMDQVDETKDLTQVQATTFRTCVGVLLYLACDMPHCQHVVRYLATYSTRPSEKSMVVLRHLVAYLASHQELCVSLKWRGRNVGVYHNYDNLEPGECVLEVFTDSDWASDRGSRRSISCATIFMGGCLLFSASRTQKLVSLSSAEAEVYACSSGTSDAILLSRLVSWMTGKRTVIWLYTDSSGARGILQRRGVGRLRHLSCRILWLQALVETGTVKLSSIAGSMNPADVGTKRLPAPRMRSLMSTLGMYNVQTGSLEGADDPAGIFKKKGNVVGQIAAILSVLSLHQVQGCHLDDGDNTDEPSLGLVIFSLMLGFAVLALYKLFWVMQPQPQLQPLDVAEPDAEPAMAYADPVSEDVQEPNTMDDDTTVSLRAIPDDATHQLSFAVPRSSTDMPTPEGFVQWLIMRCNRRLENPNLDVSKRSTYVERIAVLRALQAALENPLFRASAMRNMAEMVDISDDEESPSYRGNEPVSLGDAQRAHNFFMMLRGRSGSRHVDSVADALMRNEDHGEEEDSDERMETESEVNRRYYSSTQDQVSDPDLWAHLHYTEFIGPYDE